MAKYGPSSVVIEYDNSGGTPVNISQHVTAINDIEVESLLEMVQSFGDAWEEHLPFGVGKVAPIELSGFFDDVATTGPDALFANRVPEGPATATRTLKVTFGGTKTMSVETFLSKYTRSPKREGLTPYKAGLQPTGAVTET